MLVVVGLWHGIPSSKFSTVSVTQLYSMYVHTAFPFIMYWLRLFARNTPNFHYDVGCQGLEIYPCIKFRLFFVSYMHIHMPFKMYWLRLFSEKYIILTMTMFVGSKSFISLPSFMFVGATVSEICESNQNKKEEKNFENGYFQFSTFPH